MLTFYAGCFCLTTLIFPLFILSDPNEWIFKVLWMGSLWHSTYTLIVLFFFNVCSGIVCTIYDILQTQHINSLETFCFMWSCYVSFIPYTIIKCAIFLFSWSRGICDLSAYLPLKGTFSCIAIKMGCCERNNLWHNYPPFTVCGGRRFLSPI